MTILNQIIALIPIPLIFIAVGVFGRYTQIETKKYESGQKIFTYARSVKILGVLCGIVVIAACVGYFIDWNNPTRDGLLYLALISGVIGLPLMWMAFNSRVLLEDTAFVYYPPFGKSKRILFSEITSINYSDIAQEYSVKTKDDKKISLEINYLKGYHELLKIMEERTGTKIPLTPNLQRRGY